MVRVAVDYQALGQEREDCVYRRFAFYIYQDTKRLAA